MKHRSPHIHFPAGGKRLRVCLLALCDIACVSGIFLLTGYVHSRWAGSVCDFGAVCRETLPFLFLFLIYNALFRVYHGSFFYPGICLNKIEEIRRISLSVFNVYFLLFICRFFSGQREHLPWSVLFFSMGFTILLLPVCRFLVRFLMQQLNFGLIDVMIAGAGKTGEIVSRELTGSCYYGFRVIGFLDDDPRKQKQMIGGYRVLGPLSMAGSVAQHRHVEYVVCCLPLPLANRIFREYSGVFQHIMFVPDNQILPIAWLYPASIGLRGGFEIRNQLRLKMPRFTKKIFEICLTAAAVVVLLPLFLILALLVKLSSPGPVFYRAPRLGVNGKKIHVLKFRTMYEDADERLGRILRENPQLESEWHDYFKLKNDPRITRIGRFLRNTSLDELPQFWNVLTGEMAVIGPRPIVEEEITYYGKDYELRKRIKPGITGLWQVSGRNEVDYPQRVMIDMYYIMNWSVWMDYYIFLKTIFVILTRHGAC